MILSCFGKWRQYWNKHNLQIIKTGGKNATLTEGPFVCPLVFFFILERTAQGIQKLQWLHPTHGSKRAMVMEDLHYCSVH